MTCVLKYYVGSKEQGYAGDFKSQQKYLTKMRCNTGIKTLIN